MNKKILQVLVACEESQAVTKELRKLGHEAYSCDLLPCSGNHPEWHFNCDVFKVIKDLGGKLQNGKSVKVKKWDLMIAHPPCTYLAVSGARWFYHPDDKRFQKYKGKKAKVPLFEKLIKFSILPFLIFNCVKKLF